MADELTIYSIYLITNNLDGRNYVGKHKCEKDEKPDSRQYMGSGKELKVDQEKLGMENFSKEVLAICHDFEEMNLLEESYIALFRSIGKAEYNIADGGEGGFLGEEWRQRVAQGVKRFYDSPEGKIVKEKLRIARANQAPMSEESKEKFRQSIAEYWKSEKGLLQKQINSENNKNSHTTKGKSWYNNGVRNTLAFECPEGFVPGRLGDFSCSEETKQKKRDWYNNLTEEQRKEYKQHLSESHIGHHFTAEEKKHIGDGNRGRKYFNNGIEEVMRFQCPPGYVPGRCPKAKLKISQGMKKQLRFYYYNKE